MVITTTVAGTRSPRAAVAWSFRLAWGIPATAAFAVYSLWSVTRHERFGSGSWDLGCHNQNIWLLGHAAGLTSTVLGDVNFMGDHFMPVLVLFAPFGWTGSSSILLYVQALLLALAAWPLALLCRRRGLGSLATCGIVSAYLFGAGTQSAATFDFHEVAPLPLALFFACWAFEEGRRPLAYAALAVAAGCKEPAILYAGAVGAWLALTRPRWRLEGAAIAAAAVAWFLVVVGVIQPWLLGNGPQGMIHLGTFSALGTSVGGIAVEILRHPVRTAVRLVTPAEKVRTLATTFAGFGFLPLLAPGTLLLAVPNVLERFLSDKREMWGLGFHYSLVLTAVSALATAAALSRLRRWTLPRWRRVPAAAFEAGACALLIGSTVIVPLVALPGGAELQSFEKPYYASLEQAAVNRRAIAVIPADAALVAQDHFLPHLAMRQKVWLPDERFMARADYVVLDPTQSTWPRDRAHIERLLELLRADLAFTVVFSERATVVFARRAGG